jgi:hypothetical protein
LILFLHLYSVSKIKNNFLPLIVIFVLIIAKAYVDNVDALKYRNINVKDQKTLLAVYDKKYTFSKIDWKMEEVSKIGDLKIYNIETVDDKNVAEFLLKEGLSDRYYPISVEWQTCLPNTSAYVKYKIISPTPLNNFVFGDQKYIKIVIDKKYLKKGEWFTYNAESFLNPCSPRTLNLLTESIRQLSDGYFVIFDLQSNSLF